MVAGGLGEDGVCAAATVAATEPPAGSAHYDEVAENYEAAFFYSSTEYRDWVLGHLLTHFALPDEEARIVDLGGGTGNFTQALAEAARVHRRVLCVDMFAEMLQKALAHHLVEPMLLDAVAFSAVPPAEMRYTHVLLKELVHHIPEGDVAAMYAGLAAQLAPGGRAVTITRPQEVDYPLFQRAHEIWREHQPHHSVFTAAMEAAGLEVEVHSHEFEAELPKATWLAMMAARFWSTFSHCAQQELEQGIAEVAEQYAGQDSVRFTDRLLFLVACKPQPGATAGAAGSTAADAVEIEAAAAAAAAAAAPADGTDSQGPAGQQQQQQQQQSAQQPEQHRNSSSSSGGSSQHVLSSEQRRQYERDGFTGPLTIFSPEEAGELAQQYQQYQDALGGTVAGDWRFKSHLLLPWVWEVVHHPTLLAAVSEALGGCRNMLCWSTDWFKKLPGDGGHTGWHQDSTYVGLDPPDVVTAWLALTPATPANGCLHFQPGSHRVQVPHVDQHARGNLLLKGQTIVGLEGMEGHCIPLQPGQATLHHIRMAHRSGPAAPDSQPRLGLAVRYMAAHVQQGLEPRDSVTVVSGGDTFGLYRHERRPCGVMDLAALAEHRLAVAPVYPAGFERGEGKLS